MSVHTELVGAPSRLVIALIVALVVLAIIFNSAPVIVVAAAVVLIEIARHVRVSIAGGGFRPLRVTDLIEFAAADSLDAFDQEQANARARAEAQYGR